MRAKNMQKKWSSNRCSKRNQLRRTWKARSPTYSKTIKKSWRKLIQNLWTTASTSWRCSFGEPRLCYLDGVKEAKDSGAIWGSDVCWPSAEYLCTKINESYFTMILGWFFWHVLKVKFDIHSFYLDRNKLGRKKTLLDWYWVLACWHFVEMAIWIADNRHRTVDGSVLVRKSVDILRSILRPRRALKPMREGFRRKFSASAAICCRFFEKWNETTWDKLNTYNYSSFIPVHSCIYWNQLTVLISRDASFLCTTDKS